MEGMFFSGWSTLVRTLVIGVLAYINLIVLLRISGRRTLSKMNAFDLIVTVALGSTFATILMNRNVSLAQGTLALALLIALQYLVTWSSVRAGWVRKAVTGEPALLFYQGVSLSGAMRAARVTEDEIRSAVRSSGFATMNEVEAVVLETDGSFSVVKTGSGDSRSSLSGVMMPGTQEVDIESAQTRGHGHVVERNMQVLLNIDVADLDRAVTFYRDALGLHHARTLFEGSVAEMLGACCRLYLIEHAEDEPAIATHETTRNYGRHWTPTHPDFVVENISTACEQAVAAGARQEIPIREFPWGKLVTLSDPFGNGFCLIQFPGEPYE